MNHTYLISTLVAYVLSFVLYVLSLKTGKVLAGRLGTLLLGIGLVTHYFALLERSRGLHTVPYHDLYGSMSLFGWLLAVTYLSLELTTSSAPWEPLSCRLSWYFFWRRTWHHRIACHRPRRMAWCSRCTLR